MGIESVRSNAPYSGISDPLDRLILRLLERNGMLFTTALDASFMRSKVYHMISSGAVSERHAEQALDDIRWQIILCPGCDTVHEGGEFADGETYRCPRCSHPILYPQECVLEARCSSFASLSASAERAAAPRPSMLTERVWFLFQNHQEEGPFTTDEISAMIGDLRVVRSTPMRREGMGGWTEAGRIADVARHFEDAPQPIVPWNAA